MAAQPYARLRIERRFGSGLPELDRETELVLYRVAQEGLTNIARHAEAESVGLTLHHEPGAVVLSIVDDGRGIAPACEGAGIRGMRERVLLIGAALDIGSAGPDSPDGPGSRAGTRVSLSVPAEQVPVASVPASARPARTGEGEP